MILLCLALAAQILACLPGRAELEDASFLSALDYEGNAYYWAYWGEGAAEDPPADVFLICPAVYPGFGKYLNNVSVDDEEIRADFLRALTQERGIFEDVCALYAPYYRQAVAYAMTGPKDAVGLPFDIAYQDVEAAFRFYLARTEPDRPLVLAGYSEGAAMALRLLKDVFADETVRDRLAAAYLIGWRVTEEDLTEAPWLKMARGEDDTGCVVCFSSEAPEVEDTPFVPAGFRTCSINPLNWRTDSEPADRSLNKGACFIDPETGEALREIPALTGAWIDPERGTLKLPDIDEEEYDTTYYFDAGVYHMYECQFFYRNLQENVALRVARYIAGTDGE